MCVCVCGALMHAHLCMHCTHACIAYRVSIARGMQVNNLRSGAEVRDIVLIGNGEHDGDFTQTTVTKPVYGLIT